MKVFFCGGGLQTVELNKKINEVIDSAKPILYVPLAMESDMYDSGYERIKNELADVDVSCIEIVKSTDELLLKNLSNYSMIFIDDGNTFKLLYELKQSGAFDKINDYLRADGVVFGKGAGAAIFGRDLDACMLDEFNDVGLKDKKGFNVFYNISILCHYTNRSAKDNDLNTKYLLSISKHRVIISLPEGNSIYYNDGIFEIIGDKPCYIFEDGNIILFNCETDRKNEFYSVKTGFDLMDFMNRNITYGWVDKNRFCHLNNLHGMRENYRVSSIDKMLETGLGTCAEQAKMVKFTLDRLGLENKLYCLISSDESSDVLMHCFVLFNYNGLWYHFEHSDMLKRDIYQYDSLENAIIGVMDKYRKEGLDSIIEIPDIPDGLSYDELKQYINQFDRKK